jgi:hypothetical protein
MTQSQMVSRSSGLFWCFQAQSATNLVVVIADCGGTMYIALARSNGGRGSTL